MKSENSHLRIPVEDLRWRLDPATLPFDTTEVLQPLKEIIGQQRGVEAFRFGIDMDKPGYNVFVTGAAGSGRMATVRRLLEEMSRKDGTPEDLCYVNCFSDPESPVLIRLPGGTGSFRPASSRRSTSRGPRTGSDDRASRSDTGRSTGATRGSRGRRAIRGAHPARSPRPRLPLRAP